VQSHLRFAAYLSQELFCLSFLFSKIRKEKEKKFCFMDEFGRKDISFVLFLFFVK